MAGPRTRPHRAPVLACAALAACTALTACGERPGVAGPPPAPATAPSPDGFPAERLVLRARRTGGIAGVGGPGTLPELSLYSTGRAVVAPPEPEAEPAEYRLKPDALRRLLDEARAAGLDRSHTVGPAHVSDAFVMVVTLGDATTRIVRPETRPGPEGRFLERLDPRGWPAADRASGPRPYVPANSAVLASETTGAATVRDWPLEPLGRGEPVAGAVCTLAPSRDVPAAAPGVAWRSEGRTYLVRLRPLLPGESSCRDLA